MAYNEEKHYLISKPASDGSCGCLYVTHVASAGDLDRLLDLMGPMGREEIFPGSHVTSGGRRAVRVKARSVPSPALTL